MTRFSGQCERTEDTTEGITMASNSQDSDTKTTETSSKQIKQDESTSVIKETGRRPPTTTTPDPVVPTAVAATTEATAAALAAAKLVLQNTAGASLLPTGTIAIDVATGIPLMNFQAAGGLSALAAAPNANMMLQGVSNPLALLYPGLMSTATTIPTTDTSASVVGSVVNPAQVINVAPRDDSAALNSSETAPATTTIDIQDIAATMGSLHNAITSQIIMGIKSETSPPTSQPSSPLGSPVDPRSLPPESPLGSPETPATPDDDKGFHSKPKRLKVTNPLGSKEDKTCRVCGDRALGCNFDAVSCESCKAFFRRNALKEKQAKCLFEGSCKIDQNTRRFCPFCRLQKCFSIGMKKEFILREDEKKKRQQKVEKNRQIRKVKHPSSKPSASAAAPGTPGTPGAEDDTLMSAAESFTDECPVAQETDVKSPSPQLVAPPTALAATLESPKPEMTVTPGLVGMGTLTLGGMSFSVAGSGISPVSAPPLDAMAASTSLGATTPSPDVTNLLSLSRFAQKTEVTSNVQLDTFLIRRLTAEENHMLQELMQVYDLSFTVDLEPLIHIKHLDPSLNQLVNQSSITVLRLIKFAKRLEEFIRLSQECQIGILKGTWIHILLLRSVSLYDSERDVWVTPKGDIPTEILKNATGFVKLHDDHVSYCKSIKNIIRDDLMIVVILLVIVLFSPEGPNVINREVVSNIQDKYLILLKHYLESKYTYVRASEMYPALMSKIRELKELAEIHGKYLLDVNPNEIEPIMLEILDLK